MIERGGGSIINLSSVSGIVGTPRRAAYAASKGALDAATRSLAIELGPSGIRVNAVAPGVVDTALWAKNKTVPGVVETIESQTPLRRWAHPEDIANVIARLARVGDVQETGDDSRSVADAEASVVELHESSDDAPVVRLVHQLVGQAVEEGASDLHISPDGQDLRVRFRVHQPGGDEPAYPVFVPAEAVP